MSAHRTLLACSGGALISLCTLVGAAATEATNVAPTPTYATATPAAGAPAYAPTSLPTFAQAPASPASPWTGLTIGGGVSIVGGKGVRGGIGGDAYLQYSRELPNNLVIGVQAVSGYAPDIYKFSRVTGYDYAGANAFVGYDMGRFEPYLTAGVGFAKANLGPPGRYDTSQSLDSLFNKGGGPLLTTTTVGAGFNYAVTNNFSVGMSVSATQFNQPAPVTPGWP